MESDSKYSVVYIGKLVDKFSSERVVQNLIDLFNVRQEKAEQLLAQSEYILKKGLSLERAENYKAKIEKAGLVCSIIPSIIDEKEKNEDSSNDKETESVKGNDQVKLEPEQEPRTQFTYEFENEETEKKQDDPYQAPESVQNERQGCFCRQCGKQIHKKAIKCPFCHTAQMNGTPKSKGVAALLGITLGFLGAHRFYLGKWWGIFYLFFGLIAWVVAIIESIVFLSTPKESWERKYSNVQSSSGLIIVAVLGGVAMLGILAAIALPAYQDYTIRAKMAEVFSVIEPVKSSISDYAEINSQLPIALDDVDNFPQLNNTNIDTVHWEEQRHLVVTLSGGASSVVDGETLIFSAKLSGVHINWDCSGGTLPAKYRPSKCRAGRLSSQQSNDSTRLVKDPDEQYTFRIPRNWSSRTDLNDEASFQFANLVREEYVLVFQEQKIELPQYTLEDYATVLTDNFALSELSNEYKGESNISGLRVLNYELKGTIEGIKLNYQVGFIEGKEHYYYLLFWTIEDKKSSAFPVFNNTLHSFREL